jgi:tetratricopeptide (TPR) repeat protein
MNSSRAFEDRALASFQLALVHNQFAWLIANTEGDFDESLRCSRRSLELQPNRAGFLDTLGRCYYAKGDYVNAVKYQTQAVALEPHSPQMLAQLSLFETALEAQRAAPTPDPSAGEISD